MRGSPVWLLCTVLMACSNTAERTPPPPIRTDAGLADLASRPDAPDTRDVLTSDSTTDIGASPDVEIRRIPLVSGSPTSRLRLVVGATMVVTADKIRYGWLIGSAASLAIRTRLLPSPCSASISTRRPTTIHSCRGRWCAAGDGCWRRPGQCWADPALPTSPGAKCREISRFRMPSRSALALRFAT